MIDEVAIFDKALKREDIEQIYEMTRNNRLVNFLKSRGYFFVHFNSTWGATLTNEYADRQVSYEKGIFQNEFLRILVRSTMLKLIDPLILYQTTSNRFV